MLIKATDFQITAAALLFALEKIRTIRRLQSVFIFHHAFVVPP
jgi:hypothetical protein